VNLRKPGLIGALGIGVLASLLAIEDLRVGGAFSSSPAATGQSCRSIDLAGAAPAIAIDARRGLAYLSLLDRANAAAAGTVQLLDLNVPEPHPRAALNFDPGSFRPGDLSLVAGTPRRLLAWSTLPDGANTVEIAAEAPAGGFSPEVTLRDPAFRDVRSIVATGPRRFYFSTGTRRRFDNLLRRAPDEILYYDGTRARVVARGLRQVGGLALAADGKRLYVTETHSRALRVYSFGSDGAIDLRETIPLEYPPARPTVDGDGVVWIAAWPLIRAVRALAHDPATRVPTAVLRFDPRAPERGATTVYAGDGISAGSVAAHWQGSLIIGASFDRKVLVCKLNP
jgi:hypothetical protein